MYAILVLKYRIAPDYVLDVMQLYEARALLRYDNYVSRDSWEQSRLIAYVVAQTQSTKKLKPTEIMQFSWDSEYKEDTSISDDNIARLKAQAQQYIENNTPNNKNIEIENNG